MISFIRYFFYLARNWGAGIAYHIIRKELYGEKKYHIRTTGADELQSLAAKGIDITHATIYMPASYDILEDVFAHLETNTYKHFVDIGCGKGRAMCVAAHYGFNTLTGIDISKDFCEISGQNLATTKQTMPALIYTVINNDAFYFEIEKEMDCIFFFNPFDEVIMSGVLQNIERSLQKFPRRMTIIYLNPIHKNLLLDHGYERAFYVQKLKYLEGAVYTKQGIS